MAILERRLPAAPFLLKCAIVHSLGNMADEQSNAALMHAYDALDAESRVASCPPSRIAVRPDGKDDHIDIFVPENNYGMVTLQAMGRMRATLPETREPTEAWLEALIREGDTPELLRESAQSLLAGIREQRDDRLPAK